ncbi:MAG: YdeI/OmpD-associated family protein, partial [Actinomycetota bacterium]|nr:YdeI/OmpD-associated family protein [Actinomycetota bacterium]
MEPPGLKAFEARDSAADNPYSYEQRERKLDDAYEAILRENPAAWDFFQSQPPYYRKAASWWVI